MSLWARFPRGNFSSTDRLEMLLRERREWHRPDRKAKAERVGPKEGEIPGEASEFYA